MTKSDAEERLMSILFKDGFKLTNVKLFRGDSDEITEEDLCNEAHSGLMQELMGKARVSSTFEDNTPVVSIKEFISALAI